MSLYLICDACDDYEIIEAPRIATVAQILAKAGYKAKGRREHYCPSCQTMSDKPKPGARRCRVCGCTDAMACMTEFGPCYWVKRDLCSACVGKKAAKK